MEKLHSERHEKHTATHTATHRNALKHADIALQTPRTEFWRFGWYYYSTNCAANMELLVLLVQMSWSIGLVHLNLDTKVTKVLYYWI